MILPVQIGRTGQITISGWGDAMDNTKQRVSSLQCSCGFNNPENSCLCFSCGADLSGEGVIRRLITVKRARVTAGHISLIKLDLKCRRRSRNADRVQVVTT